MPNPAAGHTPRNLPPVTTLEPLPNNRCPRCEGRLYTSPWDNDDIHCLICGYEVHAPPPPVPTPAELRALPGAMPIDVVRDMVKNRLVRARIAIDAKRILELRAQDMTNNEIADALSISTSTLTDTLRRQRDYEERYGVDSPEHAS